MTSGSNAASATGYQHPDYARAFSEYGRPRELRHCRGWVLERHISGFRCRDAMACYPLFACQNWPQLHVDLDNLAEDLVSISLVTDPFGQYEVTYLRECFHDVVYAYKQHFVVDLNDPVDSFVSKHHHRNVRRAWQELSVERCPCPGACLDDWQALYAHLVKRNHLRGIAAFSRKSFARQLQVPGIVMLRATRAGQTMGMLLWYVQGSVGYYHLGAYSELGYELRASYALFSFALEYFARKGLRWLDLGAGAGVDGGSHDGLSRFKKGWSNGTRTAYFCGRIFDRNMYGEIVRAKRITTTRYFPAYRVGEFQ